MDFIYIEPAYEHRSAFAMWCLQQNPEVRTASAQGFNVPIDLFPEVPVELLKGSYVDGYAYDGPARPARSRRRAKPRKSVRQESAERIAKALDIPAEVVDPVGSEAGDQS